MSTRWTYPILCEECQTQQLSLLETLCQMSLGSRGSHHPGRVASGSGHASGWVPDAPSCRQRTDMGCQGRRSCGTYAGRHAFVQNLLWPYPGQGSTLGSAEFSYPCSYPHAPSEVSVIGFWSIQSQANHLARERYAGGVWPRRQVARGMLGIEQGKSGLGGRGLA